MNTAISPHLFWITSRAAGFAALILASLAVSLGLLMSTKLLKGRTNDLRVAHEVLSLSTIVAIVIHGVALVGDKYLHPSFADIAVPFLGSYKTFWTSLGIVSGWATILLGLSFYFRRQIGGRRWRSLHRFTALAWLGGLVHAIGMGTDAGQIWFLAMVGLVTVPALALLAKRLWSPSPSAKAARPAFQNARAVRHTPAERRPGDRPAETGAARTPGGRTRPAHAPVRASQPPPTPAPRAT